MLNQLAFLLVATYVFIILNACGGYSDGGMGDYEANDNEWNVFETDSSEEVVSGKMCTVNTDYRTYIKLNSKSAYNNGRLVDGCAGNTYIEKHGGRVYSMLSFKECPLSYVNSQCNEMKSIIKEYSTDVARVSCTSDLIEAIIPTEVVLGDETFRAYAETFVEKCEETNRIL
jgi:hypothetical protein